MLGAGIMITVINDSFFTEITLIWQNYLSISVFFTDVTPVVVQIPILV
jgi:hypothetical protein